MSFPGKNSGRNGRSAVVRGAVVAAALGVTVGLAACRTVESAIALPGETVRAVTPGQKSKLVVDPVEVQQVLLQFTDGFAARMNANLAQLQHIDTNALADPAEVLRWRISIASESMSIASGANPVAGMVDMAVLVTLLRATLEERWVPETYGDSAMPMLESAREFEAQIWKLAEKVLEPDKIEALREGIEKWRAENPFPTTIVGLRSVGFVSHLTKSKQGGLGETLKSLVSLDPFAGLDPAMREIAQARLFAERSLYVAQQMPDLLRWQMELASVEMARTPAGEQILAETTRISTAVERVSRLAGDLPALVSSEREAILAALEEQERQLTPLVSEVRGTLAAGEHMSTALNTMLVTLDALMQRFGVGVEKPPAAPGAAAAEAAPAGPPAAPAEPFRISDYGRTAEQLEGAARELTELIRTLDQMLESPGLTRLASEVAPVVDQAQETGRDIVDRAFWRTVLLIAIMLAAALAYRFVSQRWISSRAPGARVG